MGLNGRQCRVAAVSILGVLTVSSIYGVLAPFYPDEARLKHNSNFQIGVVISMYAVLGLCSAPIVGYLLSTGVSSKAIVVSGLLVGGVFFALSGLLDRVPEGLPFFWANIGVRLVQTLGTSICQPCFYSIIATEMKEYRNVAVATLETVFGVGMMVAPAVGGVLYENGGYPLPCYVVGCVVAAVGLIAIVFLPRTELQQKETAAISWSSLDIHLVFDFLTIASGLSVMVFNEVSLSGELARYSLSHSKVGLVFVIYATVYASFAIVWGVFVKKVTESRYLVLVGTCFTTVAAFLMKPIELTGVTISLPLQIVAQVLLGIGISAMYVCSTLHGMHHAVHRLGFPDDISTHGFVSAMCMMAMFAGCFIGPVFGGLITDFFGYRAAFVVCTACSLLTLVCVACVLCFGRRSTLEEASPSKDSVSVIRIETAKL